MTSPRHSDQYAEGYKGDPLFKGCTRPPMLFGVPVVPCIVVCGSLLLITVWTTPLFGATVPLALAIMRAMVKEDDQQFRLLALKLHFRVIHFNWTGRFWKASTYSPIALTKRK